MTAIALPPTNSKSQWIGLAVVGALFFTNATAPAYACTLQWTAPAAASPVPGSEWYLVAHLDRAELLASTAREGVWIVAAGLPTTVWNRNPERAEPFVALGASVAKTPREAAALSGVLVAATLVLMVVMERVAGISRHLR